MAKSPVQRKAPADLKAVARLKELLAHRSNNLAWHHEVGRLVAKFAPKEEHAPRDKKMTRLLDLLGIPTEEKKAWMVALVQLYAARSFSLAYGVKDLPSLEGLEFTHIKFLVGIEQRKRERFRRLCQKHRWSVRELKARVQEKIGKRRSRGAGRPLRKVDKDGPRESLQGILRLHKTAQKQCVPALEQNRKQLADLLSRQPDGDWAALVKDARKALRELSAAISKAQAMLREVEPTKKKRR